MILPVIPDEEDSPSKYDIPLLPCNPFNTNANLSIISSYSHALSTLLSSLRHIEYSPKHKPFIDQLVVLLKL